jgi:hypothetical protein
MNARDVETAALRLERLRQRTLRWLLAGAVVLAIGIAAAPFWRSFAIAMVIGALLELAIALALWLRRRERIERLALEPAAYAIPAVARFGDRVCGLSERRRLAASIRSLVSERQPLDVHLVARASRFAQQLEALARQLAAPAAHVEPATAVACRRLVTRPVESPLYNPNLTDEDLRALLLRIQAGISVSA